MSIFRNKSYEERLTEALEKSAKEHMPDAARKILEAAIIKEIDMVRAIQDMPGFRIWFEGDRFELSNARGRK